MTAHEKAKAGLWLIKEAVLHYLAEHPEGVPSSEARRELGLENPTGERRDSLFWGLSLQLKEEGRVESRTVDGQNRLFLATPAASPSQPEANA